MEQVQIIDYYPLRCLQQLPAKGQPFPRGTFIQVTTAQGPWLLGERVFHRAGEITTPQILQAAKVVQSSYAADQVALSPCGFDATWQTHFAADGAQLQKDYAAGQQAQTTATVTRRLSLGNDDRAVVVVRRIVSLARAAGIRDLFGKQALELASYKDRRNAVMLVGSQLGVPEVHARLAALGVTPQEEQEVQDLYEQLTQGGLERKERKVAGPHTLDPEQAARALLLGDMEMLAHVAKSVLPKNRAAVYRVGPLLAVEGRRKPTKTTTGGTTTAPGGTTTPGGTTAPGGTTTAAHGGHGPAHGGHAHGAHGHGTTPAPGGSSAAGGAPVTTPATGLPAGAVPPAGGSPQLGGAPAGLQQGAAPPASQGAAPAPPPSPGAAPAPPAQQGVAPPAQQGAAPPVLQGAAAPAVMPHAVSPAAGTVLMTVPGVNGPALAGVMQADGSVLWVPVGGQPAPQPSAAQPVGAQVEPKKRQRGAHRGAAAAGKRRHD